MRIVLILSLAFILLLQSCSTNSTDEQSPASDQADQSEPTTQEDPTTKNVYAFISIYPDNNWTEENSIYSASATIVKVRDDGSVESESEYNNSTITINNVLLTKTSQDGYFTYFGDSMKIKSSDSVSVDISSNKFTHFSKEVIVPPNADNLQVTQGNIEDFIRVGIQSLSLTWDAVKCDVYKVLLEVRSTAEQFLGRARYVAYSNSYSFDNSWKSQIKDSYKATYAIIYITPTNEIAMDGFFGSSCIEVESPKSEKISNIPKSE